MDKRTRKWRRHQLMRHWERRLRNFADYSCFPGNYTGDRHVDQPRWRMVSTQKWGWILKSTGTPCSCDRCTGEQYNREEHKAETCRILRESED